MSIKSLWTSGSADPLLLEQCEDRLRCCMRSAIHALSACFIISCSLSLSLSFAFFLSFTFWGAGKEKSGLDLTANLDECLSLGFMSILVSIPESERGISLLPFSLPAR